MAAYQMYRNTTLGITLQETLDEFQTSGHLSSQLAIKFMSQFDKSINKALSQKVKSKLSFKGGNLRTYRFCDNVWTFVLHDVEFRESQEFAVIDKLKIVACDGKAHQAASDSQKDQEK